MGLLDKIKKETAESLDVDEKISKKEFQQEAKDDIHYLKGDVKNLAKQLRTKESVVIKNDAFAILHSGAKNQKSFFSEFENFTKEGYVLTGITDTRGIPLSLFGFNVKSGQLFFFQHKKFITNF